MRWTHGAWHLVAAAGISLATASGLAAAEITLLNVSYDPTRELFTAYNRRFAQDYEAETGHRVRVIQSHGGSGKQARAVIDGLRAHVVTLALAYDVQAIADHHLIRPGWQSRLPHASSPCTSTIVFLVRPGNPKGIRDWGDLVRPGVGVITPNPKTSGGARWNFLAAWAHATRVLGEGEAAAVAFMRRLYGNVPILDTGARGATTTFVQRGIGDVLLAWESEAALAAREYGTGRVVTVYPPTSVLVQPTVAVVDRNVDRRGQGPEVRAAAEAYLRRLYSEAAQDLIAQHGYRPVDAAVLARHAARYPPLKRFTVGEIAGSWRAAQKRFFGEDGVFDTIHRP
ncbi:MAG: sulfate ABC transporter substrate-binding protein [Verrucomicrobia bacterium]|nr:sulfate ABC transporter substrate-binding protein [Verrucomicrobiota bacterium]